MRKTLLVFGSTLLFGGAFVGTAFASSVTGANATTLGAIAIFMIGFGGGLILLSRRPRRGRHAA